MLTGYNYPTRDPWVSIMFVRKSFTGERMVKYSKVCIQKLIRDDIYIIPIKHGVSRFITKFRLKFK